MRTTRNALIAGAASLLAIAASPAQAANISISCGAVGLELELCKTGAEAWAAQTGNTVSVVSTPNSATERLALYQQILNAQASDIDVFQIDVVWPGILASHLVDLKPLIDQATIDQHFPAIIANNTIDGQLVGMPWFTDAGLLYYRTDLLEKYGLQVPTTWQELTEAAQKIQDGERGEGNDRFFGFVFQGKAYEGLTCDALEWVDSFGGGTIVGQDGKVTIDNPQAVAAIDLAASWIGTIAPEGVLNYAEEEARGVFQSGNAAFMRNWPYAYDLAQSDDSPVKGKVGVAALPSGGGDGGKPTGTLGGWQLAVSKYSQNQDAAVDLVRYLTSIEEQKRRAVEGSYLPTIAILYEDPEIAQAAAFMGQLLATFQSAVARPSSVTGERYNEVSAAFFNAVHSTLSGNGDAAANLKQLSADLNRLSRGGRW